MRNLFKFIQKYQFFFLFLVLTIAALLLTISTQQYQQSLFLNSSNRLIANIYYAYNSVNSYFSLREENQRLINDYAKLLEKQAESFIITDKSVYEAGDSAIQRRYSYMAADVINNSVVRRNNYITLNKGFLHGVKPDMGIITPDGVAGIVVNVSKHFSVAMSLLHSNMLVSAKVKKNNQLGSLQWEGVNHRTAYLTYLPPHLDLSVGDSIVTSGFSTVFPENIFIGTIQDREIRRGDSFFTAEVELALDFNSLTHVLIVKNLMKDEQTELELSVMPE